MQSVDQFSNLVSFVVSIIMLVSAVQCYTMCSVGLCRILHMYLK